MSGRKKVKEEKSQYAEDVTDSYLAELNPALLLLTCKLEPGDDGNRK